MRTALITFQERETQGRTVATAEELWYHTQKCACGQPLASACKSIGWAIAAEDPIGGA